MISFRFFIFFCATSIYGALAFYPKVSIVNDDQVVKRWSVASRSFDEIAYSQKHLITSILEKYLKSESSNNMTQSCKDALVHLDNGLRQRKLWAYEFIDAMSKGDISYSRGNVGDLGKSDTCVNIHVESVKSKKQPKMNFRGRFCVVNVNLPVPEVAPVKADPMTAIHLNVSNTNLSSTVYEYYADRIEYFYRDSFSFGICVPSTCTKKDINSVIQHFANATELTVGLRPHCDSVDDRKKQEVPIEGRISMIVILVLIFMVIMSTALCVVMDKLEIKDHWTFLQHFNAVRSHKKLVEVSNHPSHVTMRPMEAFIAIAQIFAVAGHGLVAGKLFPTTFPAFKEYSDHFGDVYILKQYAFYMAMGAQAFFACAGFFCCYIVYPMMVKAKGRIPFHLFLLKRWLRTIPTLGFMIAVTFATSTFTTNPSVRDAMDQFQNSCKSGWWKTLLMINNYDNKLSDICVLQSWYMSADFQLWLLSYLPLVLLVRAPKLGVLVTCLFMLIGCVSTTVVTHIYDLPSFLTGREFELFTFFLFSKKFVFWFLAGYNGLFSYFFGFLIAYHCLSTEKIKSIFSFRWIIINSLLLYFAGAIILSPVIWTKFFNWPSVRWFEVLYASVSRAPFGLFYAFILLNIYYGFYKYLPFMQQFIDRQFWVVVGRLAFTVFLSHILTIVFVYASFYELKFPSSLSALGAFFLVYEATAFFLAYLMYLIVEAPFASLLSILVKKISGKKSSEDEKVHNIEMNPEGINNNRQHNSHKKQTENVV